MKKTVWKTDGAGGYLSPEKQRSERALEKKRQRKKQGDSYNGRKLVRLCPKCNSVIKKERRLRRNDSLGIYRDVTVFVCEHCNAVWNSKQTNKVWQRLKKCSNNNISNKTFNQMIDTAWMN